MARIVCGLQPKRHEVGSWWSAIVSSDCCGQELVVSYCLIRLLWSRVGGQLFSHEIAVPSCWWSVKEQRRSREGHRSDEAGREEVEKEQRRTAEGAEKEQTRSRGAEKEQRNEEQAEKRWRRSRGAEEQRKRREGAEGEEKEQRRSREREEKEQRRS